MRVIDAEGNQLGIMATAQALDLAADEGLDLVEVQPTAVPPVCRLMDYGREKYEQARRERESRKKQTVTLLKEVRLAPDIGEADLETKMRNSARFLGEDDKVKFTVRMRGREQAHPELARSMLERIATTLSDVGHIEGQVLAEGRSLNLVMAPGPGKTARPSSVS
ncbi:MAG: translation initiation factor IF-3 [Chloroflexota bacterium]